jgi:hypothetical protein
LASVNDGAIPENGLLRFALPLRRIHPLKNHSALKD